MIRRTNDYLVRALNNFAKLIAASLPTHPTHPIPSEVKASINGYSTQPKEIFCADQAKILCTDEMKG
jgi:hypothetical protein